MYFIGVDVSKNSLDICIIKNNKNSFFKIDNNLHSINDFFIKFIDKKVSIVACMCAMIKWLKNLYFNERKVLFNH